MENDVNPYAAPRPADVSGAFALPAGHDGALSPQDRRRLSIGFGVKYIGSLIATVAALISMMDRLVPATAANADSFRTVVAVVIAICGFASLVGDLWLLMLSTEFRFRRPIYMSMAFLVFCHCVRAVVYWFRLSPGLLWFSSIFAFVSFGTFLVFVMRLAVQIARPDFGRRAKALLVWTVVIGASDVLEMSLFAASYGGIQYYLTGTGHPLMLSIELRRAFFWIASGMYWTETVVTLLMSVIYVILLSNIRGAVLPAEAAAAQPTDRPQGQERSTSSAGQ